MNQLRDKETNNYQMQKNNAFKVHQSGPTFQSENFYIIVQITYFTYYYMHITD